MGLQLIKGGQFKGGGDEAKVFYCPDHQSFVIRFYRGGKHQRDLWEDMRSEAINIAREHCEMRQEQIEKDFGVTPKKNTIKPARRTVGMPSQREHINPKTGKATKKPTERLMRRRQKDTIPGYYPNPATREKTSDEWFHSLQAGIRSSLKLAATQQHKQGIVSYFQGQADLLRTLGMMDTKDHRATLDSLKDAAK